MATVERRQIEWDSAEIKDATLTVELAGSASKAWKARLRACSRYSTDHEPDPDEQMTATFRPFADDHQ